MASPYDNVPGQRIKKSLLQNSRPYNFLCVLFSRRIATLPSKIFIGGLAPSTSHETLRKYFEKYGELSDCVLMTDKTTGRSRGFGFVTFKHSSMLDDVLNSVHVIDEKEVDCKRAVPRDQTPGGGGDGGKDTNVYRTKKLFVGGLPQNLTEEEFRQYFSTFGGIEDLVIMTDKETGKSRGFGFVTFDNEESVERVIERYYENKIGGKWVECKRALPRDISSSSVKGSGGQGPGMGGRHSTPRSRDRSSFAAPHTPGNEGHMMNSYGTPSHNYSYSQYPVANLYMRENFANYPMYSASKTQNYPPQSYGNIGTPSSNQKGGRSRQGQVGESYDDYHQQNFNYRGANNGMNPGMNYDPETMRQFENPPPMYDDMGYQSFYAQGGYPSYPPAAGNAPPGQHPAPQQMQHPGPGYNYPSQPNVALAPPYNPPAGGGRPPSMNSPNGSTNYPGYTMPPGAGGMNAPNYGMQHNYESGDGASRGGSSNKYAKSRDQRGYNPLK